MNLLKMLFPGESNQFVFSVGWAPHVEAPLNTPEGLKFHLSPPLPIKVK